MKGQHHHNTTLVNTTDIMDVNPHVMGHILTQLSLKCELSEWQQQGEQVVTKELSQLHYRDTFEPVNPSTLSKKEMERVIESHLFLKLKCDATIKGRMVAGRDKQCSYIPKEEATSPTVSLKLVLLTAIIDMQEGQDVAICDVPNAFIQT